MDLGDDWLLVGYGHDKMPIMLVMIKCHEDTPDVTTYGIWNTGEYKRQDIWPVSIKKPGHTLLR